MQAPPAPLAARGLPTLLPVLFLELVEPPGMWRARRAETQLQTNQPITHFEPLPAQSRLSLYMLIFSCAHRRYSCKRLQRGSPRELLLILDFPDCICRAKL